MPAVQSTVVPVNAHVIGHEWAVADIDELGRLIAIILLGQAEHAAEIISTLEPSLPAYTNLDLVDDAQAQMLVKGKTDDERKASRAHRDGFLFECMSWIAARQAGDDRTFLKDPHLDPTSHGLDGLIIQLAPKKADIIRATICEDKCTEYPRVRFRDDVMRTFRQHHHGTKRARDLVANAVELLRDAGLKGTEAVVAAEKVTNKSLRCYRAALTTAELGALERAALFKGYDDLDNLQQSQRVGALLPLTADLRDWFQELADKVVSALNTFASEAKAKPEATKSAAAGHV